MMGDTCRGFSVSYLPAGWRRPAWRRTFSCLRVGNQLQLLWFVVVCCFREANAVWATGSCSSSPVVMYKQLRKQNKNAVFLKTTAAHAHLCDTQPSPPKCERVTAFCVVVFLLSRSLFFFFGYYSCSCWLSIFLIFSALKMPCSPPSGQKTTMHCTLTKQLFGHFFLFGVFLLV